MNPENPIDIWLDLDDDLPPPAWALVYCGEDEEQLEPICVLDDDG